MPLLDDLRAIEEFTPSQQPTSNELLEIVGKLIVYVEHGDQLFKAADQDVQARDAGDTANHVNELISPPPPEEPAAAPSSPAPLAAAPPVGPDPRDAEIAQLRQELAAAPAGPDPRDAEIAQLRQELATAQAQSQRTTATVEPVESPAPVEPPPATPPGV